MGVIVPKAKMPNNCEECDFKALCEDYWKNIRETYTRPSWCSLDDIDTMYFCGVPIAEAVEVMRMYKNGELVHLADRKTENCSEKPNNCEDDEYWKHLFIEVVKGHMSDAEANQAWYEYINHKDEPQTDYDKYREKIRPHDPHKDWVEDEPQTERKE